MQLQFGMGAYKRSFVGAPEIKLLNRFVEAAPANLREKVGLMARCGTNELTYFAPDTSTGKVRRLYSKDGMFNNDLFAVSGSNLYRYTAAGVTIPIAGIIADGLPKFTWDRGIGYEHLFVSDGQLLQVYTGGSKATGTLTGAITNQTIEIGGTYYAWTNNVDFNSPSGQPGHPWCCLNTTGDDYTAMSNMINFIGTPGVDFSTNLRSANLEVVAAPRGGPPATSMQIIAYSDMADGNSITTTEVTGSGLTWTGATLTGGGVHALQGVYMPTGLPPNSLCTLDSYVIISMANSNAMFFLNPGSLIVGALDFFSKESNPDPIVDVLTVGDVFVAAGSGSIETWYATGDLNAPFAPIEGRTVARGCIDGSLVLVQDQPILVGSDGIVYSVSQGLQRISDHGIEERIRMQLRLEAGIS